MNRFEFNPAVDRSEVEQFGFVDLRSSFENGILSGDLSSPDSAFNGVGAPGLLLPRSQDVFESLRKVNYVKSAIERARSKEAAELAQKQVESPVTQ